MPNKHKVLVFGTFDNLHPGHLNFLQQAKKYGNYLVAVIARDSNVKKNKGHWPRQEESMRLKKIQQLKFVDDAVLGYRYYKNKSKIIQKIKPQIICLGYDQPALSLKSRKIKIIRLKPYQSKKYKSSIISALAKAK